jgi:N-hydroxyarylamine O-acetyltransferase
MPADALIPDLLERVLASLGFARAPAPDLAGLKELYGAWCRRVPFDNVRKLIHLARKSPQVLPGDTAEDFFAAWLKFRTGGTCWAANGALCSLLSSLGFAARRGIGTMMVAPDAPPNHGTVIVDVDPASYLVDASILYVEPLRLDDGRTTTIDHPSWGVRATPQNGLWHVHWRPFHAPDGIDCRIDHMAATRAEFHEQHEKTRGWSPFNFELHARGDRNGRVLGIARGERLEFETQGTVRHERLRGADRKRVLVDELGISEEIVDQLPADVPTPPPPGSRTALKS